MTSPRLTQYGQGAWRGGGEPGRGCLFGSRPLRFAGGIHRRSGSPGEAGVGRRYGSDGAKPRRRFLAGPPPPTTPRRPFKLAHQGRAAVKTLHLGPGAAGRLLTPSTACTSGVFPSSSASAQLTSAPCARAAARAGRSRVRAARCASSPGCSSRTSARPQVSASPSASPLDSSDSAPSARTGRSGPVNRPGAGEAQGRRWGAAHSPSSATRSTTEPTPKARTSELPSELPPKPLSLLRPAKSTARGGPESVWGKAGGPPTLPGMLPGAGSVPTSGQRRALPRMGGKVRKSSDSSTESRIKRPLGAQPWV